MIERHVNACFVREPEPLILSWQGLAHRLAFGSWYIGIGELVAAQSSKDNRRTMDAERSTHISFPRQSAKDAILRERRRNDCTCGVSWCCSFGKSFHVACSSWAYALVKSSLCVDPSQHGSQDCVLRPSQ